MQRPLLRAHGQPAKSRAQAPSLFEHAPLVAYFALAYALTWAWWLPLALTGRTVEQGSWRPTHLPGEFGPLLAAFIVVAATKGRPGVRGLLARMIRWRVDWRWWLVALSPLLFFGVAAPAVRLVNGDWPNWGAFDRFSGAPAIGVLGLWLMLVAATGFGEEVGWRGFATPALQRTHSALSASLILALFWMAWHIPAFAFIGTYRDMNPATYPGFFIGLACGAIVLTWLYNRSGGSLLLVALWHGTYDLVSGAQAVSGAIAAIVSALVMALAFALVLAELRARRHGEPSVLGVPPAE